VSNWLYFKGTYKLLKHKFVDRILKSHLHLNNYEQHVNLFRISLLALKIHFVSQMESLSLLSSNDDVDNNFGSDVSMRFLSRDRNARNSIRYENLNDHKIKEIASLESQGKLC
jgi:hypothetical protein